MELPKRKSNRLTGYDYGQEGSYFITQCTHNRARLFQNEDGLYSTHIVAYEQNPEPTVGNDLCVVPPSFADLQGDKKRESRPSVANQIIHKWIQETERKFSNIIIDKYVIMADHLHFIITIQERQEGCSVPDVMKFFKTMTTNTYIQGVKAGILPPFEHKIWQKSYYDHVIRNQEDYDEIWQYIQNNPTKWELIYGDP